MSHAYQQLYDESKKFTTINSTRGLFQYQHLPFEILSVPTVFQRTMDSFLHGLPTVIVYLDEHSSYSSNFDHVMDFLESTALILKQSTCVFMTEYLGHVIDKDGSCLSQGKALH